MIGKKSVTKWYSLFKYSQSALEEKKNHYVISSHVTIELVWNDISESLINFIFYL